MYYTDNLSEQDARDLAAIMSAMNIVELVTPTNAMAAKADWLNRNDFEAPTLVYNEDLLRATASKQEALMRAEETFRHGMIPETTPDHFVRDLLLERIRGAIDTTNIAASILLGDNRTTAAICKNIYGVPSANEVLGAYESIRQPKPELPKMFDEATRKRLKELKFDANQIKFWFERTLQLLGITSWTVIVSDQFTSIDVRDRSSMGSVVGIPSDCTKNGIQLIELIGHEILSHLLSSENTRWAIKDILGSKSVLLPLVNVLAKAENETLYEGAAKRSDVRVSGADAIPLPYYTIACHLAMKGKNFAECAEEIYALRLANGAKPEAARKGTWTTCYRVALRGSTNPEEPYMYPKDYCYRSGWQQTQWTGRRVLSFSTLSLEEAKRLCECYGRATRFGNGEEILEQISQEIIDSELA